MVRIEVDRSMYYQHSTSNMEDIVITRYDHKSIKDLKQRLFQHFKTKDLGQLQYFLGIEVVQSRIGIPISQRKYALDILEETWMLDCKPVDTLVDPNVKLLPNQRETFQIPSDIGDQWES